MRPQRNATRADDVPVHGLVRTRHTLVVCVVCGHERLQTDGLETSCPDCGSTARRSFAVFRDLREKQ